MSNDWKYLYACKSKANENQKIFVEIPERRHNLKLELCNPKIVSWRSVSENVKVIRDNSDTYSTHKEH